MVLLLFLSRRNLLVIHFDKHNGIVLMMCLFVCLLETGRNREVEGRQGELQFTKKQVGIENLH